MKVHHALPFQSQPQDNPWEQLKQFTDARIALGRVGGSLPTKPLLQFQLAHAQAKDAVHKSIDLSTLKAGLEPLKHDILTIGSCVTNRDLYLKRPDLGRELSEDSRQLLHEYQVQNNQQYDVLIVVGDGLSARAIEDNAPHFIQQFYMACQQESWTVAPFVLACGSRVALGDEVAQILKAKMLVMLIGERPGLSSPDSMGIYYTWQAHKGCHDAMRNCISNVRPAGLSTQMAIQRLMALLRKSCQLGISGIHLKDEHEMTVTIAQTDTAQKCIF